MLAGCEPGAVTSPPARQPVTIAGRTFDLELALDDDARYRGLSDRRSLADDGGMLFVFPRPHTLVFVMRRCLVPIDVVFLDPGGRVVATHAMRVEPYDQPEEVLKRYTSRYSAQFAIELRGGTAVALGLEEGQQIDLPTDRLKRLAR